jgi:hypothetical protein
MSALVAPPAATAASTAPTHVVAERDRALAWGAALVLALGSLLFLYGGRSHPAISVAVGADLADFIRAFAETVRHTHGWHGMHMLILIGPLCWAVGAPALLDAIHPAARGWTSAARSALLLSGALWAVAFVLDGFGAPVYANALTGASAIDTGLLTSFQANALMMSRLGLVSWIAGGLGMVVLGASMLAPAVRTPWRMMVGVSGIMIGVWPLLAALEGEYAGGPFTSAYWMINALVAALWYVALATCVVRKSGAAA